MSDQKVIELSLYTVVASLLSEYARDHCLPKRSPEEYRTMIKTLLRKLPDSQVGPASGCPGNKENDVEFRWLRKRKASRQQTSGKSKPGNNGIPIC